MRWKEDNVNAILNAKGNEISGNVAVMAVANKEAIFVERLKFLSSDEFKMFDPLHTVIIVRPSLRIACKHPTVWKMLR